MEHLAFVDRVLSRLPARPPTSFAFDSWSHANRPTKEGFGIGPVAGLDPQKAIDAVMDVDHYVGNVEHVTACRAVKDARFVPPESVRFYQKIDIPMIGSIHHELVLHRLGEKKGYLVAAWHILTTETNALSTKDGFRSDYNHGAWFAAPGVLGYALGSAPKREDLGLIKWKMLTTGADAAAGRVVKGNIEGMGKWAMRR